ncbi:hypothetical protein QFC19_009477 [Naganishia cerealis]|uniref:Uncharacterized protein n=1 Tax=Naganishia cerealis TaxID=610337 RepID=A0ACC2UVN4_9TREE|nr:hypothetical protein QFC19_009477 [Naganishia cerealis]
MAPGRKGITPAQDDASLDPVLQSTADNDSEAGPSKRAKKPAGKTKTTKMTAERKEANRLAAERSRVRRAARANILEQTAKGLAEENLVLKERIRKLVAMGVGVDVGVDLVAVDSEVDRPHEMVPSQSGQHQRSIMPGINGLSVPLEPSAKGINDTTKARNRETSVIHREGNAPILQIQWSDHQMPPSDVTMQITSRTNNTSSLHQEMEGYFRQQMAQLKLLLHERREQFGSDHRSQAATSGDQNNEIDLSSQTQVEQINDRLLREIQILHDVVLRVKADRATAKTTNERLKAQVKAAEAQLLVREHFAKTEEAAALEINERRLETQKAFKDVKRHLGLLIGVSRFHSLRPNVLLSVISTPQHFNPSFVEPDLPEQEAFVVPAPYESAPLPEPQKRGRPPLAKPRTSSQSRLHRKISAAGSMTSPIAHSLHYGSGSTMIPAESSSSTTPLSASKSSRSKKRYEPSKVRYRLDADPDVIYIEEREIIQDEHGEQEIVHISKKPVYNPRPRSGAGRKPTMSRTNDVTPGAPGNESQDQDTEQDAMGYDDPPVVHDAIIVDPTLESTNVMERQALHEAAGVSS